MPKISTVGILQDRVDDDLDNLGHQAEGTVETRLRSIKNTCELGPRDPRTHHDYQEVGSWKDHSFYRTYAGKDSYRLIFAVYADRMTLIAVEEKDDTDTYNVGEYRKRMRDNEDRF